MNARDGHDSPSEKQQCPHCLKPIIAVDMEKHFLVCPIASMLRKRKLSDAATSQEVATAASAVVAEERAETMKAQSPSGAWSRIDAP